MVAQLVILAALIGLEADFPTPHDGIQLKTADGLLFDIVAPTASIGTGSDGVFNNFGFLQVNGWLFQSPVRPIVVEHLRGSTVVTGPAMTPDGLIVTRSVYVPSIRGKNYARFLDVVENPSDETRYVLVQFFGFAGLGSVARFSPQTDDFGMWLSGSLR